MHIDSVGAFCIVALICFSGTEADHHLAPSENFTYHAVLDVAENYQVFWKYNDTHITFEVHVAAKGYVGFGVSATGGMVNADVIVGWVKDGEAFFQDRWATGNFEPNIDEIQDWELLEGHETDTHTVLKFQRPLVTCDAKQDLPITGDTVKLIWSYHDDDPSDIVGLGYHGNKQRGSRSLLLLENPQSSIPMPDDVIHMDFLNRNVSLPAVDTTYWCEGYEIPELDGKHHVIKIEPVIKPGNEGIVHHIIIYGCNQAPEGYHGASWNCFEDNMEGGECLTQIAVWGIGGEDFSFPEHVGLSLGDSDSPKYVRLETHFDNPLSVSGIVDNSGLRMTLTPTLRKYDAGVLMAGMFVSENPILPPSFDNIITHGHCTRDCLQEAMPDQDGVSVFAVILHTHLLGTALKLRHFRDGVELPPIAQDAYYDFNYQEIRTLKKEVIVKPTDNLVVECHYKTSDKTAMTFGGLETSSEMCLAFVYHYPRLALSDCLSMPSPSQSVKFLGAKAQYSPVHETSVITYPLDAYGTPYYLYISAANWEDKNIKDKFVQEMNTGEMNALCLNGGSTYFPGFIKPSVVPQITQLYTEKATQCIGKTGDDGVSSANRQLAFNALVVSVYFFGFLL